MVEAEVAIPEVARPPLPRTLGSGLGSHDNALNFVRLVLATAVIVAHTGAATGLTARMPSWTPRLGDWAVNGFFALSGFLVAGSRMRLPLPKYLWNRAVRIFPGFWVQLLVVGGVFALLAGVIAHTHVDAQSEATYVLRNLALTEGQSSIAGTLQTVPDAGVWNESQWTLPFEFLAYVATGLLLALRPLRSRAVLTCSLLFGAFSVVWLFTVVDGAAPVDDLGAVLRLGTYFLVGMALYFARDRLTLSPFLALAAVVVFAAFVDFGWGEVVDALPFAYLLLWLGARLPVRWGAVNDVSYGVYIYGYPVQQMLVLLGAAALGPWWFAALAIVVTAPFAVGSWFAVEKRAKAAARFPA